MRLSTFCGLRRDQEQLRFEVTLPTSGRYFKKVYLPTTAVVQLVLYDAVTRSDIFFVIEVERGERGEDH
jgi:hypothetical protein